MLVATASYVNFENISEQERIEWVKSQHDWPALKSLLSTNNPADNQPYLLLNAHYAWNGNESVLMMLEEIFPTGK